MPEDARYDEPRARLGQGEEHAGPVAREVGGHGPAREEQAAQETLDRAPELLEREVPEQGALVVGDAHRVEHDVDPARGRGDGRGVGLDRPLVEHVEPRRLSATARRGDVARDGIEVALRAAREEDARALPREGPGHGPADRASDAVDHGDPVLQQSGHVALPVRPVERVSVPPARPATGAHHATSGLHIAEVQRNPLVASV